MSVRAASTSYSAAANYAALRSNMASLVATPVSGYAGRWRRTRWRDGASGAAPVRVPDEASAEEGDILYAFRDKPGAQELAQARDSYQHISARAAAQHRGSPCALPRQHAQTHSVRSNCSSLNPLLIKGTRNRLLECSCRSGKPKRGI
jgi:hypothetical protein